MRTTAYYFEILTHVICINKLPKGTVSQEIYYMHINFIYFPYS